MASKEGHISKTTNISVAAKSKGKSSSDKEKYINTLSQEAKERYKAKLYILGLKTCPYLAVCLVPGHLQLLFAIPRVIYERKAEELQVARGLQLLRQWLGASWPVLQNRQNKITAYRQR